MYFLLFVFMEVPKVPFSSAAELAKLNAHSLNYFQVYMTSFAKLKPKPRTLKQSLKIATPSGANPQQSVVLIILPSTTCVW